MRNSIGYSIKYCVRYPIGHRVEGFYTVIYRISSIQQGIYKVVGGVL